MTKYELLCCEQFGNGETLSLQLFFEDKKLTKFAVIDADGDIDEADDDELDSEYNDKNLRITAKEFFITADYPHTIECFCDDTSISYEEFLKGIGRRDIQFEWKKLVEKATNEGIDPLDVEQLLIKEHMLH